MIVEGIYEEIYSINGKLEIFIYIWIIEVIDYSFIFEIKVGGVVYGVLDDEWFDYIDLIILRVLVGIIV